MAVEFVTTRDSNEQGCLLLPPGLPPQSDADSRAPIDNDGSSFLGIEYLDNFVGMDLPVQADIDSFDPTDPHRNLAYGDYVRMHKVLVGQSGGRHLESIYERLKHETMPRDLNAAGWAIAEAALVMRDDTVEKRLGMLDMAVETWQRAYQSQRYIEQVATPVMQSEYDRLPRIALDIAIAPLLAGVIVGDLTKETCQHVFKNCLNIAEWNAVAIRLALQRGNVAAANELTGFAYECNALLARNRTLSNTWFAIPAMARCDSGFYYGHQTHDLLVIRHNHGSILHGTPVEIKGTPSRRDKDRYDALLVRGKMHLSIAGKYTPDHTLRAIGAAYRGDATDEEKYIARSATETFVRMLQDYYAGAILGTTAMKTATTFFHDKTLVKANHPGLEDVAA